MIDSIKQFIADERGATAGEYVLLASLIAAVVVIAVKFYGVAVKHCFEIIESVYPG